MVHKRLWRPVIAVAATLGLTAALAACGGDESSSDTASGGGDTTLNVLSWQDYLDEDGLAQFTEETGVEVNVVNVGSPDEMFAKVKSNPDQWDLVLATSGWFSNYVNEDLIVPMDDSKVDADIQLGFDWQSATTVDGTNYGVLYNWGDQPLGWLPDSGFSGQPNDWNVLWDPKYKGQVSVFDDPTSVLPMIALAAGIEDPFNLDEEEFQKMSDKLMALRPQIQRLTSGYDDQVNQFASGEATIGYLNIISVQAELAKKDIKMDVSNTVEQGVPAWSDNYTITKAGEAKGDAVYDFINYTLTVPWQARFIQNTSNNGVFTYDEAISPEAEEAGLTEEVLDGTLIPSTEEGDSFWDAMLFYQTVDDLDERVKLWNEFKLGIS